MNGKRADMKCVTLAVFALVMCATTAQAADDVQNLAAILRDMRKVFKPPQGEP